MKKRVNQKKSLPRKVVKEKIFFINYHTLLQTTPKQHRFGRHREVYKYTTLLV